MRYFLIGWLINWLNSIYLCSDVNSMKTTSMTIAEIHVNVRRTEWTYFSPPTFISIIFHQLCLLESSGLLIKLFWIDFLALLLYILCYFLPGTKICLDHYKRPEFFWGHLWKLPSHCPLTWLWTLFAFVHGILQRDRKVYITNELNTRRKQKWGYENPGGKWENMPHGLIYYY